MSGEVEQLSTPSLDELRRRRSAKWKTYPDDVLPLTVAEMDFPLAEPIRLALAESVERSDVGYAWPDPALGSAFAGFAASRWDWDVDPAAVIPVTDVGVGVVELLRVVTRPGDAIAISPPVYEPFFGWVREVEGRAVEVPLRRGPEGWRLDLPALESAFAAGVRAYILCNPHNPVGRAHTSDELQELVGLATRYGVTLISDEIHAPLVLAGATFTPLLSLDGAAEISVALTSATKAWNLAGLKCALVITGSPTMAALVDSLPRDTPWRVGQLGVVASIAAFDDGVPWLVKLLATLDATRSHLAAELPKKLPSVRWLPPEATYLAWLDCSVLGPGDEPQRRFLEHGKVALQAGPNFGSEGSGFVRLNFATSTENLDEALDRMAKATQR